MNQSDNTNNTPRPDNLLIDLHCALKACTNEQLVEVETACGLSTGEAATEDNRAAHCAGIVICAGFGKGVQIKAIEKLGELRVRPVFDPIQPNAPVDRNDGAINELRDCLEQLTPEQFGDLEARLGLSGESDAPIERVIDSAVARNYDLNVVLIRISTLGYAPRNDHRDDPIVDLVSAASKATPEQMRDMFAELDLRYNEANPQAADSTAEQIAKEFGILASRSDGFFQATADALSSRGLRPTFREVDPCPRPYTLDQPIGVGVSRLNADQLAELETRLGLETTELTGTDRVQRVLDQITAHHYNFFVVTGRLRDAGIRPMDCMPARENDEGGEGGPRKFSIGGVDVFVL